MQRLFITTALTLSMLCLAEGILSSVQMRSASFDEETLDSEESVQPITENGSVDITRFVDDSPAPQMLTNATLETALRQGQWGYSVNYKTPRKLNSKASCKYCQKCESIDKIRRRISTCKDIKSRLSKIVSAYRVSNRKRHSSGYSHALMVSCYKTYCKSFKPEEFCGLKRPRRTVSKSDMSKQLKREEAEHRELFKRFQREAVPRFKHKDYMKRREAVLKDRQTAQKSRLLALNAHKENRKLKKKMQRKESRKNLFNREIWANEAKFYAEALEFWQKLSKRLHFAVRTSPLAVKHLLRDVRRDMRQMAKDRAAVSRMRKGVDSLETNIEKYTEYGEWLDEKAADLLETHKDLKAQQRFLKKAGGDLTRVLRRLVDHVRNGNVKVGCEEGALGDVISQYAAL